MKETIASASQRFTAACALVALCCIAGVSRSTETPASPSMPAMAAPPAGQYHIDKSHASLLMRANHFGFSTYTTRFSRYDSDLTFDPNNIPASRLVTTIDPASFEMDGAPQFCLDIMKGPNYLDVPKYPTIVFRSDTVRMTGPKSFEIAGTLELHGVTRPLVLTATYNGGYAGMPEKDPHARIGFSAHGSFKRSEFGMTHDVPPAGTTMGVGDLVDVTIEAEFNGPPLAATPQGAH